ncbi:hypothetical protein A9W99_17655 [Mycobacterium sp. 1164966.3]|nr:hypothetical protein A9W99_17655 [Mycobacterium sp. 1164966.3]
MAATVCAHIAYLIYVPSGGFLALRWPRTLVLHVPAVVWGIAVVGLHLPCPLTQLEEWARARANLNPLPQSGFVDGYLAGRLVPPGRTGAAQAMAFVAAAVSWAVFAARRPAMKAAARQPIKRSLAAPASPCGFIPVT